MYMYKASLVIVTNRRLRGVLLLNRIRIKIRKNLIFLNSPICQNSYNVCSLGKCFSIFFKLYEILYLSELSVDNILIYST